LGNPHHPRPYLARAGRPRIPFKLLDPNVSIREQGFYYGFPCHLGHTVRHEEDHWCYECVRRIQSNVVGLDVNFINDYYRNDVIKALNQVSIGDSTECWENKGSERLYFSSWTRLNNRRRTKVKVSKLLYTLFWGDVGKLSVTRHIKVCENPNCVNPLHLVCTWNTRLPPRHFHYMDLQIQPKKMAVMALREHNKMSIDDILMKLYKPTILHPKERRENP